MSSHGVRATGLGVACAAVGLWLVDLAVWQPASEPKGPDASAENNAYWARDLRWALIAAAVVGVVLAYRGARRPALLAAIAGLVWPVADALLDRLDVGPVFGWSAGICVVLAAVVAFVRGRATPVAGVGRGPGMLSAFARGRATPVAGLGRGALTVSAFVAAGAVPLAAATQSPTDTERALTVGSAATAALLVLAAFGAAAASAPSRRRNMAAVLLVLPAFALVAAARAVAPEHRAPQVMGLAVLMLTGVWALSRRGPWTNAVARCVLAALALTVAYTVVSIVVFLLTGFTSAIATVFTWLAGSPAVNSSDTDALLSLPGIVAGLAIGLAVYARDRPRPAEIHGRPTESWPELALREPTDSDA